MIRLMMVLMLTGCAELIDQDQMIYTREMEIECKGECKITAKGKIEQDEGKHDKQEGTVIVPGLKK